MTQPLLLDMYNKSLQSVVLVNEDSYQEGMTLGDAAAKSTYGCGH